MLFCKTSQTKTAYSIQFTKNLCKLNFVEPPVGKDGGGVDYSSRVWITREDM